MPSDFTLCNEIRSSYLHQILIESLVMINQTYSSIRSNDLDVFVQNLTVHRQILQARYPIMREASLFRLLGETLQYSLTAH